MAVAAATVAAAVAVVEVVVVVVEVEVAVLAYVAAYFDVDHWENLKSKLVYYYTRFMLPELFSHHVQRLA